MSTKALVLAAGLGSRLKPITNMVPKSMVPFFGVPLCSLALYKLQSSRWCSNVAINTHHMFALLHEFVRKSFPDVYLSHEKILLGTGGALRQLDSWRSKDDVLIYNADIVANFDLDLLVSEHKHSGRVATMVLLPECPLGKNPVFVKNREVVALREWNDSTSRDGVSEHTLAGVHIISAKLIELIPPSGFFDIIEAYQNALQQGWRVGALIHNGPWHDLGSPQSLFEAHHQCLTSANPYAQLESFAVPQTAQHLGIHWDFFAGDGLFYRGIEIVAPTCLAGSFELSHPCRLGPNVAAIGPFRVGEHAIVENSLILPNALIQPGQHAEYQVMIEQNVINVIES